MAPGMNRSFESEHWSNFLPKKAWYDTIDEANDLVNHDIEMDLQGYDKDPRMLKIARQNAQDAEVDHLIHFQQREVKDLRHPKPYGFIIANPPYGERLEDHETLPQLYTEMKEAFDRLDTWSKYVITSYEDTEKYLGKPTKKRKLQWNDPRRVLPVPWTETAKKEKIMKQRLIFATGNEHKMKEIREILDESKYEIISMKEAGVDIDIVEDGKTFEENAFDQSKSGDGSHRTVNTCR